MGGAMTARLLAVAALAALSGCAAPYFAGQTGRVTPRKDVRAALATGYNFASSAADVVRDAKDLVGGVQRVPCPTEDEPDRRCFRREDLEPIVDAAYRFALVSPFSSHSELSARYGLLDRVDAGLHLSPGGWRLDVGLQAFGATDPGVPGWAGSLFVGAARRSTGVVGDVLSLLRGEAKVTDLDALFVSGRQFGEVGHLYVGGRYMLSRWSLDLIPTLPIDYGGVPADAELLGTDQRGVVHQIGAITGGAVGWKRVFVGAELATTYYRGDARVLSRDRRLEGVALMPSVYVYGTY
jgi:hypothetical protein